MQALAHPFRATSLGRAVLPTALLWLAIPLAAQSPVTTVAQINTLTNQQAAQSLPVILEATVTFPRPAQKNLFIIDTTTDQNGTHVHGCYVRWSQDQGLIPGDRIRITGATAPSFRPIIHAASVTFLHHGALPPAPPATFADLIQAKWDSHLVTITGRVLSASLDEARPTSNLRLRVHIDGGNVGVLLARPDPSTASNIASLLDAQVRLTGVAGGEYDSKMQMAGVFLSIYDSTGLTLLHPPPTTPWTLPTTPIDQVIGNYRYGNISQRVRILGTLTYYEPGFLAVLEQNQGGQYQGVQDQGAQQPTRSIFIKTNTTQPLHTGASVEATGFPAVTDETVRLESAVLRPAPTQPPLHPETIHWDAASIGSYAYNLISMEGTVVSSVHDSRADLLLLQSEGHLFSATLRHSSSDLSPANVPAVAFASHPSETIAIGSRIRVTGVCFLESSNPWRERYWFDLRLRSPSDVTLLAPPSWWTVQHLFFLATLLGITLLISALWVGRLERRLREKSATLARRSQEEATRAHANASLEQQRSRILELISSTAPLPEVLEEIQSLATTRLSGAPCWFHLTASTHATTDLPTPESTHPPSHRLASAHLLDPDLISRPLHAHDGHLLGHLICRPHHPHTQSKSDSASTATITEAAIAEIEAILTIGARLAELAIETRRLYADLRHRSEYDLLTDIPNRFALERRIAQLISRSEQTHERPHPTPLDHLHPSHMEPNHIRPNQAQPNQTQLNQAELDQAQPDQTPFGLLYIDLDRFKQINDRHGHRIGDLYLQAVTARIAQQLRSTDFFARIGGDEFIVLIPLLTCRDTARFTADEILQRIERCFTDPFQLESHTLYGSASLGLAIYPHDGLTAESLQRHADTAMYHHKQSRRHPGRTIPELTHIVP